MAAPSTWQELFERMAFGVFRGEFGRKYFSTLAALFDSVQTRTYDALISPWLAEENGPAYDALRPLGQEMSMPQYPVENWLQYRSRLRTAWPTWQKATSPGIIIDQLALAGFPGAQWFRWSQDGSPSEFVIFFPTGTHTVTSQGPSFGSFTWGDGTIYGPVGLTGSQILTIREIIRQWKPALWVCKRVVFELSGWTWGDGHNYGDLGLVFGGDHAFIGTL